MVGEIFEIGLSWTSDLRVCVGWGFLVFGEIDVVGVGRLVSGLGYVRGDGIC